ncbi:IclR family transcriptional regulator [Aurantimicrobium minutum]|uniref:IclR family transcriptional regulator n=1 Tax=Aurantimicrobium minutum TaxID=708131 RepID=UPI00247653F4|nr:IclR family transcriptional regulator [Aurantimicrobium minutum]MDH6255328.1 DNA-binding IclR family transcriptional regulator [Aurantimicrobium minutum]MDH6409467.1 DNA-binding IclR family transcriptional regulator [Aurantimicrobium minutum]
MSKVPAADSTLRILEHLAHQRGPVPAQSIATALELPRSSVYQILTVLTDRGFALHIPEERRYGLGPAAFELSSAYTRQQPLTRLGAPLLAKLVDHIGESAHLAVLHGTDVLYVVEERAPRRPSLVTDVGVRLPAHLTASGRALLSALPPAQLRALYPDSIVFTQRAGVANTGPRTYRELKALVSEAASQGYSIERGEITEGLASVGVVVKDHIGWPAAGIAVTFSAAGLTSPEALNDRINSLLPEMTATAHELSRRIHGAG